MTLDELEARVKALADGGLWSRVRRAVVKAAADAQAGAVDLARARLETRSGSLLRSISWRLETDTAGEVEAVVEAGRGLGYSHEEDATIRPTRAKMLRIPLPPALTGAGVDRYGTPLRVTGAGQFHVRRGRSGRLLLFKNDTGEPWYLLHPGPIQQRGRHYLRDAGQEAAKALEARLERIAGSLLGGSDGGA